MFFASNSVRIYRMANIVRTVGGKQKKNTNMFGKDLLTTT